ncbi:hypothetical protein V6N12_022578 [Hibiscus sabdariffa]|uniref:Uncharacterized protein n=1 Tax=Hibiscus sabdariffa TaxID=183260 RepID=A0ABR2FVX6_9ROSI
MGDAAEEPIQRAVETVNDEAVSLNNSGCEDEVTGLEPESNNESSEGNPLGGLFESPAMLAEPVSVLPEPLQTIGEVQQQSGVLGIQSLVQPGGSSMTETQSLEEPVVGEQQQVVNVHPMLTRTLQSKAGG